MSIAEKALPSLRMHAASIPCALSPYCRSFERGPNVQVARWIPTACMESRSNRFFSGSELQTSSSFKMRQRGVPSRETARMGAAWIELQKEISDVPDSYGGAKLELHEFVCSGAKPGSGHQPAHLIRKGTVTADAQLGERSGGAVASSERLFCNGREYAIFETPEIKIDPDNVYTLFCGCLSRDRLGRS